MSEDTAAAADQALAAGSLPSPARRIVLEGRDELLRALRARAADAAAS